MESSAVTYGACADSFVLVFNSLLAAASFVSTIMLGCTVVLIVLARRAFHQIFGVIFTLLLLGYVVCNTINLASFCLTFFHAYPDINTYLDVAYDGSYTYTGCLGELGIENHARVTLRELNYNTCLSSIRQIRVSACQKH
ncbi:unnamed protein product [Heligmosomoides polygyrus]|uniref:G_PROTEIN_RECEP_F1_2 domain-containing protein n=1 Tax=Heligmosomoides polygyrus TaxID=6339 RepID=A0A183GPY4_HELPZ|nr:unnamed protein product [Heligmosomoides polygyrus]